jgi:hypothetical protein
VLQHREPFGSRLLPPSGAAHSNLVDREGFEPSCVSHCKCDDHPKQSHSPHLSEVCYIFLTETWYPVSGSN